MPERRLSSLHSNPLFSWLRFGRHLRLSGSGASGEPLVADLAADNRRALLDTIGSFLLDNDLAVNPANLTIAWNAFSGASPSLSRRISKQLAMGRRITQQWLDGAATDLAGQRRGHEGVRDMLEELDKGVRQFTRSTSAARSATSEYHSELDRHVTRLGKLGHEGDAVSRLLTLSQAMAERTRQAEADLRERENEAKALRRRLGKARREAERDHLTGLPNRRAFEAELERQYVGAAAAREPLSIAFCDIDHFKRINDRHGHDAGDRVLKLIAKVLADSSNDNCHVSRHGGEEFVLLFRALTPPEAKTRLDAAREDLASRRLLNRETGEPFGTITFSAGIADVFAHDNPRNALKAADAALYRAKEAGRNRVLVA